MKHKICVFCGSLSGVNSSWTQLAKDFGAAIADSRMELIYGGGHVGLMGAVASGCLDSGGVVRGVIPQDLIPSSNLKARNVTEVITVRDLLERKQVMMEKATAFAVLPGGLGTLDEALEVITWKALNHHQKPIVFLSPDGFWDHFLTSLRDLVAKGFIRPDHQKLYSVVESIPSAMRDLIQDLQRPN